MKRGDEVAIGVLGAPHPGDVESSGMGAPVRSPDEHPGHSDGDRLRQGRHQRHHPPGWLTQGNIRTEIIQHGTHSSTPRAPRWLCLLASQRANVMEQQTGTVRGGEFFEAIEFEGLNHQSTSTASLAPPHTILILQFQCSPITMRSRSLR